MQGCRTLTLNYQYTLVIDCRNKEAYVYLQFWEGGWVLQPPEILFMFQNLGSRHLTIGKRCVQICNSKKKKIFCNVFSC